VKKLHRVTIFTAIIVTIAVLTALLRPWQYLPDLPLLESGTALTVNSPLGKAEVYLDGKKIGETPYSSENLSAGDYFLEIRRVSAEPGFYQPVTKQIHLEPNTRTFVEAEIGPGPQFSSVILMYYTRNTTDRSSVYINTTPKESSVTIDDTQFGESPVATDELSSGKHTISVNRVGYEELETVIIAREGYTLIAEFQLMAQPIELSTQ
jgi:hypothetical protein